MKPDAYLELPELGRIHVPDRFRGLITPPKVVNASLRAEDVFKQLLAGRTVVVASGEFVDLKILVWYVMRYKEKLDPRLGKRPQPRERRERQDRIREKIHRLMVIVRGEDLVGIDNQPRLEGLSEWSSWDHRADRPCLVPARRIIRILTDMRRRSEGISIRALDGDRIVVLPQVYVPFDQSIIDLLDRELKMGPRDDVLEIGTGTGVLALLAARKGARRVVATDILEKAVQNASENAERLGLADRIEVRGPSDLFECVEGRFDVIIFNPPWIRGSPGSTYEKSQYDPGGEIVNRFISGAGSHLNEGGRIYLIYSDISEDVGGGHITELMELISECDLRVDSDTWRDRRSRRTGSRERVHLYQIVRKGSSLRPEGPTVHGG